MIHTTPQPPHRNGGPPPPPPRFVSLTEMKAMDDTRKQTLRILVRLLLDSAIRIRFHTRSLATFIGADPDAVAALVDDIASSYNPTPVPDYRPTKEELDLFLAEFSPHLLEGLRRDTDADHDQARPQDGPLP